MRNADWRNMMAVAMEFPPMAHPQWMPSQLLWTQIREAVLSGMKRATTTTTLMAMAAWEIVQL
jgi:hypothetical protein